LTVLLSKNFKEAHIALKEKGIMEYPSTSVGSINGAPDTTLFRAFSTNLEGYYFSPYICVCASVRVCSVTFFKAFSYFDFICLTFSEEQFSSSMAIGDRIRETGNAITPVTYLFYIYNLSVGRIQIAIFFVIYFSYDINIQYIVVQEPVSASQHNSQELVISKATDQENVVLMNLYEDIMSELDSENDLFTPNKRSKTFEPLEDDADLQDFFKFDTIPFEGFDQFLEQQDQQVSNQKQIPTEEAGVEIANELQEILNAASRNTSTAQTANVECTTSSFQEVNVQPEKLKAPALNAGEWSSTALLHESNLQSWYNPQGMASTSTLDSHSFPTNVFNGNSTFPNVMGNSQMQQFQPGSSQNQFSVFPGFARGQTGNFSVQPVGQHFQAYNQFLRNNNTAAYTFPAVGANTWLRPMPSLSPSYPSASMYFPTLEDIQDYVQTWEVK